MKKRILKAALAVIITIALVATLASCAGTTGKLPEAESASGSVDGADIRWSYSSDDKTLALTGSGAIPDFESSESVPWKDVRHSVEELELDGDITSIGAYAFYFFAELEELELHEGVTSLGDLSLAFCSSLKSVELPESLTVIGDSCFETCSSLESVFIPSGVTSIGERAFTHCSSLKTAIIMAQLTELGSWTFKGCTALDDLCFYKEAASMTVADDAFEDCAIGFDDVSFTELNTGDAKLTVNYVYENGETAAEAHVEQVKFGAAYSVLSPSLDGYVADKLTVNGTVDKAEVTVTVTYTPEVVETEAAETEESTVVEEDEKKEGVSVGTIIAVVILVLVIGGVIVLAIVMMRSDKKQNSAKGKNQSSSGKSKKK